jgi:catechol 2,3-dioxygenase
LGSAQPYEIAPNISVAKIKLNVYSIENCLPFYRDLLGFRLAGNSSEKDVLLVPHNSNDSDTEVPVLHLSRVDAKGSTYGEDSTNLRAGLYHFAILLPSRKNLANIFNHLHQNSNQVYFEGAADHLVSESLYLRDPEFNGVEIYRDRHSSEWKRHGQYGVEMMTNPLDVKQLVREAEDKIQWRMPPKTVIGHVHLHVSDLIKSSTFYSEILGLHNTCSFPGANFFAANSYHHHVAINTWLGNDIREARPSDLGLDHFSLNLQSKENLEDLLHHMKEKEIRVFIDDTNTKNESYFILDPDKIKIQIYYE